jgi:hypothetical protein
VEKKELGMAKDCLVMAFVDPGNILTSPKACAMLAMEPVSPALYPIILIQGSLPTDCKECIKDRRFPHQVHGSLYPLKEEPASAECICMRGQKDGHNFTCVPKYDEKTLDLTILIVTFCIIFLISYILIKLFPNRHYTAEMIEFEASRHLPSFNKEMEFKDSPTDQDEEELKPSSNRMETEGVLFTSK